MTLYSAINPFPVILNLEGSGLNGGSVYIGLVNQDPQTFPQQVYWDAAGTDPASQPLATIGGYITRAGTPTQAYPTNTTYSIRVRDRFGVQVFYAASVSTQLSDFIALLASSAGADQIGTVADGTVQDAITNSPKFSQSVTYPADSGYATLGRFPMATSEPWGVTVDDGADNTAALQAAIIANYGGALFLPDGVITVFGEITITQPIRIIGLGTTITTTSATANIFKVSGVPTNPGVQIETILFNSSVTRTNGCYIRNEGANGTKIRRSRFDYAWIGVADAGGAIEGFEVTECYFYAARSVSVAISAQTLTQGSVYCVIENNTMLGETNLIQTPVAIQITSLGDGVVRGNSTLFCQTGMAVVPAAGQVVQLLLVEKGNVFDSGTDNGVTFAPTGGTIRAVKFRQNWIATFDLAGLLASGTGTIQSLAIYDNLIGNNTGNGIHLASTIISEADIQQNQIGGNGGNGVDIVANLSKFKVIGNTIGVTGQWGDNGAWNVLINAGTSDDYIVTLNLLSAGGSGAFSDGGSGVNKIVTGNLTI
jgi:hypothetical protein